MSRARISASPRGSGIGVNKPSMKTILIFLTGVVFLPAVAVAAECGKRTRDWIRAKRGLPCPKCHDEGCIEDVDIDSRSVSVWPCTCAKGRAYAARIQVGR